MERITTDTNDLPSISFATCPAPLVVLTQLNILAGKNHIFLSAMWPSTEGIVLVFQSTRPKQVFIERSFKNNDSNIMRSRRCSGLAFSF